MRTFLISALILAIIPTCVLAYINASPTNGEINSTSQVDQIAVNTDEDPIYAIFFYDKLHLWCKIVGQNGKTLAEYDLNNGNVVELVGAGSFTLEVYSVEGTGSWNSEFINKQAATEKYPDIFKK